MLAVDVDSVVLAVTEGLTAVDVDGVLFVTEGLTAVDLAIGEKGGE